MKYYCVNTKFKITCKINNIIRFHENVIVFHFLYLKENCLCRLHNICLNIFRGIFINNVFIYIFFINSILKINKRENKSNAVTNTVVVAMNRENLFFIPFSIIYFVLFFMILSTLYSLWSRIQNDFNKTLKSTIIFIQSFV